jgi:regulatory protein
MQINTMTAEQAYAKLTALCARSEHCQHDMTEKMRQWGLTEQQQAEVMQRLVSERYVDDERFTRAFVADKIRYNKWGRRKVEQALRLKHIDSDIARNVLDDVPDEEYLNILRPMLKAKRRSIKAQTDYEQNMKLMKYALGRGFTIGLIKQCIDVEDDNEFLD